jgi:hypothetical protein
MRKVRTSLQTHHYHCAIYYSDHGNEATFYIKYLQCLRHYFNHCYYVILFNTYYKLISGHHYFTYFTDEE